MTPTRQFKLTPCFAMACGVMGLMALNTGCQIAQKPSLFSRFGSKRPGHVHFENPDRMAVIWQETSVPARPGHRATRGFGGRVYFYNKANEPVRANGEFVVFAFDDSGGKANPGTRVPDRKYVFRESDFQQHHSDSSLGPSYSVWVPWDETGGESRTVVLLPVFRPTDGPIVQSGQSIAVLTGPGDANRVNLEQSTVGIRQVSADLVDGVDDQVSQAAATSETTPTRRTTTINMSRSLGNQLRELGGTPAPTSASTTGEQFHSDHSSSRGESAARPEVHKKHSASSSSTSTSLPGNLPVTDSATGDALYQRLRTERLEAQRARLAAARSGHRSRDK